MILILIGTGYLEVIDIKEANVGDCVYALLTVQSTPVFCEITRILEKENAVEVFTDLWGNRTVMAPNAYWEEKAAKKGKIVKIEHNYKQWAKEYMTDEETEIDNRIDTIHHGKPEVSEDQRKTGGDECIPKRVKRKQKIVRKSSTRKRKSSRNRKTRSKEK